VTVAVDGTSLISPGPEASPGFLLWRVTLRWQRDIAAALRPLELTHVQFVLLASVWWLADQAAVDVMMTSQVLRVLETRGLVARSADPSDARVKRLTTTRAGQKLVDRAVAVVEAADAEFFDAVDEPNLLLDILHQLSWPAGG